jgi:hypothetical protein
MEVHKPFIKYLFSLARSTVACLRGAPVWTKQRRAWIMAVPSESSRLLVSRVRLPENAHVYYTQFTCLLDDPYPVLDAVRRSLVSPGPPQPILDCLFPRIHISKDGPQLTVFCLGSQVSLTAPNKLNALAPTGLDSTLRALPNLTVQR